MSAAKLLEEILTLKLQLDLVSPSQISTLQSEIDRRVNEICLIAKLPESRVRAVVAVRYAAFVKSEYEAGKLVFSVENPFEG